MKVSIVVRHDAGRTFRGEVLLGPDEAGSADAPSREPTASAAARPSAVPVADFGLPIRAFVKKYAVGRSGPEKFALLLARLTNGDTNATTLGVDLEREWNSMTALMGGEYNTAYPLRAKERGWVDSPKRGVFKLSPGWGEVMRNDANRGE